MNPVPPAPYTKPPLKLSTEFDEPGLDEKEGGQGKADAANKRP